MTEKIEREKMCKFLRQRYGREPTEQEIDRGLQIYEIDTNRIRCFFRRLSRIVSDFLDCLSDTDLANMKREK